MPSLRTADAWPSFMQSEERSDEACRSWADLHRRNLSLLQRPDSDWTASVLSARSAQETQGSSCDEEFKDRRKLRKKPLPEMERPQYSIDLARIRLGLDKRTSVMIKNIPNKYTQRMLLQTINKRFSGTFNFLYLPIDFRNKCNVGYAFINFVEPTVIIRFYEEMNGKKWERFHSAKLRELAYARIQGVQDLVRHFQRSSVMNQEAHMRPLIVSSLI